VQTTAIDHLSVPADRFGEASAADMEWFLGHEEGEELAAEWGNPARQIYRFADT
jgi:hypothetical protein